MQCAKCGIAKLSQEFPLAVGENCEHPAFWCLKCCIANLGTPSKCPECSIALTSYDVDLLRSSFALITQSTKFAAYSTSSTATASSATSTSGQIIVTTLSGEHYTVPYSPSMQVSAVQQQLAQKTGILPQYQQLVFNRAEVLDVVKDKSMTLQDYKIQPGSVLQLMRLLYAIDKGSSLNEIVFDLYWGYPAHGTDYLDGTCIAFAGQQQLFLLDYACSLAPNQGGVSHSDAADITSLFFVLSAYNCSDIALFPKPSVKLYERSKPNVQLCPDYRVEASGHSQAVIMCYLAKRMSGWKVVVLGKNCGGNAKNYNTITAAISGLFASNAVF